MIKSIISIITLNLNERAEQSKGRVDDSRDGIKRMKQGDAKIVDSC